MLRKISRRLLLALVSLIVLAGCNGVAGPQAIHNGHIYDYVSNVEPRNNGFNVVWFRFDPTAAYCTNDKATLDRVETWGSQEIFVIAYYETINFGASDGNFLGSGCPNDYTEVEVNRLVKIEPASCFDPKTPEDVAQCKKEMDLLGK